MNEIIDNDDAQYAFRIVKRICSEVGTGLPGSLQKPGTKNVKRLLIISGHHDSAPENTWLRFLGYRFFILLATFFIGFIIMLTMSIIQLSGMIRDNADLVRSGTLRWIIMVYTILPGVIFAIFFVRKGRNGGIVPG